MCLKLKLCCFQGVETKYFCLEFYSYWKNRIRISFEFSKIYVSDGIKLTFSGNEVIFLNQNLAVNVTSVLSKNWL